MNCIYGPGGALVCDEQPTDLPAQRLDDSSAGFYGGRFLIAESMSFATAEAIAAKFGMAISETKQKDFPA
jgi:hypothetical protein